jgi:hypothetical protein
MLQISVAGLSSAVEVFVETALSTTSRSTATTVYTIDELAYISEAEPRFGEIAVAESSRGQNAAVIDCKMLASRMLPSVSFDSEP